MEPTPAPVMEVEVAPETRADLEARRTLRCLFLTKHDFDTRSPKVLMPWGVSTAESFARAILETVGHLPKQASDQPGQPGQKETEPAPVQATASPAAYSVQPLVIRLEKGQGVAICFDLFLGDWDEKARSSIVNSFVEPIYFAKVRANAKPLSRNKGLDHKAGSKYEKLRESDHGPLPLFTDIAVTMVYSENERVDPDVVAEWMQEWEKEETEGYLEGDENDENRPTWQKWRVAEQ